MTEFFIAAGIVGSLSLLAYFVHWASLEGLASSAVWLVVAGLALGVPTGAWYHVELRRALLAKGVPLPARWWLKPVDLNEKLAPEQRWRVLSWFALGGAGWLLTMAGCVAGAVAVGRVLFGAE